MSGISKVVHDKILVEPGGRTMHHTVLEGPLTCLSVNRDCSQVVVAGRNVFKIFHIEDLEFVERVNLRVGRNLNLNFSTADVAWNPVEDHLLASAATNGAVVTWNLNKSSKSKQDHVYHEHNRSVNRVVFHSHESNLLISGSLDGTMKLFDLRKKEVANTFYGKSDSVRDVQFHPHNSCYFLFAAACDNGNIQLWDMRNTRKCEKQLTMAHNGPAYHLDWHPDEKNWLASAGRDKMIKVWDLHDQSKVKNTHSVQTIAGVGCIKWRPQRRYHIASCAVLVDFSINVWDIRRPYIPFAAFDEHKDIVSGIVWKPHDPHLFFSSSRDCNLYQHMFRDAIRPADNAPPVGLHINLSGGVAHASSDKLLNQGSRTNGYPHTRFPSFFRRGPDRSEQFTLVTSVLCEFEKCGESLSMEWFTESARRYQLTGKPPEQLCEHNAKVALSLDRHQVAQTWQMLQLMYSETMPTPAPATEPVTSFTSKTDIHRRPEKRTDGHPHSKKDCLIKKESEDRVKHPSLENKLTLEPADVESKEKLAADTSTGVSEEESDAQDMEQDQHDTKLSTIASGAGTTSHSDFFFGDGEVDQGVFEYEEALSSIADGQEWSLPNEAFQLRQEIEEERAGSPNPMTQPSAGDSPSSANESEMGQPNVPAVYSAVVEQKIMQGIMNAPPFISVTPPWQFTGLVCDMLQHYAEGGDVQTAVSVIIVLGDKIRQHVDEQLQEHWFMSYIDLLGRFKLWSVATEVIKLSNHPVVSALNQASTTIHTHCSGCGKTLMRSGWLCDRCKGFINTCSICHQPVKGLYAWCQGCSHGGHLEHIREWLTKYRECPTGCGHLCEYT